MTTKDHELLGLSDEEFLRRQNEWVKSLKVSIRKALTPINLVISNYRSKHFPKLSREEMIRQLSWSANTLNLQEEHNFEELPIAFYPQEVYYYTHLLNAYLYILENPSPNLTLEQSKPTPINTKVTTCQDLDRVLEARLALFQDLQALTSINKTKTTQTKRLSIEDRVTKLEEICSLLKSELNTLKSLPAPKKGVKRRRES